MLMQLDDFQFSIGTAAYTELHRQSQARWASIPLLGGGEVLQALGRAHDTIILSGTAHPQVAAQVGGLVGTVAIDSLRDLLDRLRPLLLQSADGNSFGYWVILDLENRDSRYLVGGVPRQQVFRLTLKYYGESPE